MPKEKNKTLEFPNQGTLFKTLILDGGSFQIFIIIICICFLFKFLFIF